MMRAVWRFLALLAFGLALAACARSMSGAVPPAERAAIAERMLRDITVLASDEFGGRKPGTTGEARTLAYLTERMREIGLVSGTNDPGSEWRAPVELVSTRPMSGSVTLKLGRRTFTVPEDEAAAFTGRRRAIATSGPATGVPVIFAGKWHDTRAPEAVAGAVVVLLDRPDVPAAQRAAVLSERATAVLVVVDHATKIAEVRAAHGRERLLLADDEVDALVAYVTAGALADILGDEPWQALQARATLADFAPTEIDLGITIEASADRREFASHNVIGRIPGQRSESGAVLLLAHWDHLGECGPSGAADRICRGAVDNASGVALMLELARRLRAGPQLDRDIYVLATTAEEAGLLGARAFASTPPIPLTQFAAGFNFDTVAVAPAGSPVAIIGSGRAPFEPVILAHLAKTKRALAKRDFAETFLQRQDGWALLQQGVPTVLVSSAFASQEVLGPYLARDYHSPNDRADQIELGGAIDDLLLHELIIRDLAMVAADGPVPAAP